MDETHPFMQLHYNVHEKIFVLSRMLSRATGYPLHIRQGRVDQKRGFIRSICYGALCHYAIQFKLSIRHVSREHGVRRAYLEMWLDQYEYLLARSKTFNGRTFVAHTIQERMEEQLQAPKASFDYEPFPKNGRWNLPIDREQKRVVLNREVLNTKAPPTRQYETPYGYVDSEGAIILYPPAKATWSY